MLHIIELQESMEVMSGRASARIGLGQLASNGESSNLVLQPVVMLIITFLAKEYLFLSIHLVSWWKMQFNQFPYVATSFKVLATNLYLQG